MNPSTHDLPKNMIGFEPTTFRLTPVLYLTELHIHMSSFRCGTYRESAHIYKLVHGFSPQLADLPTPLSGLVIKQITAPLRAKVATDYCTAVLTTRAFGLRHSFNQVPVSHRDFSAVYSVGLMSRT